MIWNRRYERFLFYPSVLGWCLWVVACGAILLTVSLQGASADFSLSQCLTPCSESGLTLEACLNPVMSQCKCPVECAKLCTGLTGNVIQNSPIYCGHCAAIELNASLSPVPGTGVYAGLVATHAATNCVGEAAKSAYQKAKEAVCEKGPKGCCITTVQQGAASGSGGKVGEVRKEECANGQQIFYGDCYCHVGNALTPPKAGQTYEACVQHCTDQKGEIASQGIGLFKPKPGQAAGPGKSEQQFINALCFTLEQCASDAYGGSAESWVKSSECPAGKGKCLAPEPELKLSTPVLGVTAVKGMRRYVDLMFRYLLAIVVITAAIAFIWGGFRYIVGSSMGDISSAKDYMTNAVIGLFLSFGAVVLLNTVNPATTRYDKLDVYLINKEEFSELEYCKDYRPQPGASLKFAEAGEPPGSKLYDSAEFSKDAEQTFCGKEYYPQGFGGKTCKGTTCPNKGEACLKCESGISACMGNTSGAVCIKASIAGNVAFRDGRKPLKIYLLAVCNAVQPPTDSSKVADNVPEYLAMDLVTGDKGMSFMYAGKMSDVEKFKNACASRGGLRGALLGVVYTDTEGSAALQTAGAAIAGTGVGVVPGAALSVAGSAVADVLIVSRQNCGGNGVYAGYADGTASSADATDMKTALYCGYRIKPKEKTAIVSGAAHTDTFNSNSNPALSAYWDAAELEAAFKGDAPITCNLFLSNVNAPSDPGTKFMSSCKADWQPL